jgi:hypothetical protein
MDNFNFPLIDYRTFLSDVGTGLIALISIGLIIFTKDTEGHSRLILELCKITGHVNINELSINITLLAMIFILFIAPLIGFIINAISYTLLNYFFKRLADNTHFNQLLKSLRLKNYLDMQLKYEDIEKMPDYFIWQKDWKTVFNENKKGFYYSDFIDDIRVNLLAKTSRLVGQYDRVLGGFNMCRNITFLILLNLYVILYIYAPMYFLIILSSSIVIYRILNVYERIRIHFIAVVFVYIIALPIITFSVLYFYNNFNLFYSFELIIFTISFELLCLFLSGFFIVYNNYDIYNCFRIKTSLDHAKDHLLPPQW